MPRLRRFLLPFALLATSAFPQPPRLTAPKDALGFNVGDDYHMASYAQLEAWWKKLAAESNRMKLVDIGLTAENRHQYMAIISSPENLKKLDHYRQISRRLALAEGLSEDDARKLAGEGKAVVWIDGGLHATETVGSQQLMEWVYQMVSRNDSETQRFLNDVILLCVAANPDGQDLVANWYMRNPDPVRRSLTGLPRLYEKYAGHDDNRDFYMSNLPETTNMNRILYREWFPQIMYNHHQTGPRGAVVFIPPFRDPFNYNYDPLIVTQIEQLGSAMHSRLIAEGKPGSGMRSVSTYSTWYNGGLRTTTYFHNMIGLLTEIIGGPAPTRIPLIPERQLPTGDLPAPVAPQEWHYRQSIEYEMTQNRAVMDYASRYRETLLYNIYRMGRNSIERGSTDSWTTTPRRIAMLRAAATTSAAETPDEATASDTLVAGDLPRNVSPELYKTVLHKPELRDARGYILPSDAPDFPTATKFVNILIKCGIAVHRATSAFTIAGKSYPAGSYVVKSAQAFRPHVLDMFEPQDHPNDFRYPGGPPVPPYDATGYTLAFLMGVQFDRILDGFDGPFEKLAGEVKPPAGAITGPSDPAGYLISHRINDSFIVVNRLLKQGCDVYWMKAAVKAGDRQLEPGAVWVPATKTSRAVVEGGAKELGVNAYAVAQQPSGDALKLKPVRIGLIDQYGGSMPSGWVRLILERFEFPFEVVFSKTLDQGNLASRFDALVFLDTAIRAASSTRRVALQPRAESIPEENRGMLGRITPDKTIPQIRKFIEAGGDVITIGGSTSLAGLLGLPLKSALTERGADGVEHALPRDKFYVPGAVLRATLDNTNPLAYGFGSTVDVFFDNDPVYKLAPDAAMKSISPVAWFSGTESLRSGWAWGQQYLDGGVAIAEASIGEGKLFLLGPEVTFRAQPHGTFKFLFNGIYYGTAKAATLGR